jgi:hypothetical protein
VTTLNGLLIASLLVIVGCGSLRQWDRHGKEALKAFSRMATAMEEDARVRKESTDQITRLVLKLGGIVLSLLALARYRKIALLIEKPLRRPKAWVLRTWRRLSGSGASSSSSSSSSSSPGDPEKAE